MKAARLYEYDPDLRTSEPLKIEEVPEPEIRETDDVIVRVGGAGLCRTDIHIIQGLWDDALVVDPPYILGHENAGWVEEVGAGVRHVKPGDPVLVIPALTDGVCHACRRGEDNQCENLVWIGIQKDGGFADLMVVKERNLIALPEGLDPVKAAPLPDAGLTAYHTVKRAAAVLHPGATVALIGIGGLGHLGLQALRALTSVRVIAIDVSETGLELARELGADRVLDASANPVEAVMEITEGKGADAVIDFVGEGDVPAQALEMTRFGGCYFVVGYGGKIDVPTMQMIATEKRIIGNLGGTSSELMELVALCARGQIEIRTQAFELDRINEAISDLTAYRIKGRAVLTP
jgi:NAD+-dependent secondary alcohol dehydrogenase Adh1